MSTTNREKRKQAKQKKAERKARTRTKAKPEPTTPPESKAGRFFGWDPQYHLAQDSFTRRGLDQCYREAVLDRDAAEHPDLYRELAAGVPKDAPETYLRFGDLPPDERSRIRGPSSGSHERGVSVFAARETAGGHYLLDLDNSLQYLLTAFVEDGQRPAYLVRGRFVGYGTNGEPLLRDAELEPLPDDCAVVTKTSSYILEDWNDSRGAAA